MPTNSPYRRRSADPALQLTPSVASAIRADRPHDEHGEWRFFFVFFSRVENYRFFKIHGNLLSLFDGDPLTMIVYYYNYIFFLLRKKKINNAVPVPVGRRRWPSRARRAHTPDTRGRRSVLSTAAGLRRRSRSRFLVALLARRPQSADRSVSPPPSPPPSLDPGPRIPVPIHRHRHVGPSRRLGLAAFMFR